MAKRNLEKSIPAELIVVWTLKLSLNQQMFGMGAVYALWTW